MLNVRAAAYHSSIYVYTYYTLTWMSPSSSTQMRSNQKKKSDILYNNNKLVQNFFRQITNIRSAVPRDNSWKYEIVSFKRWHQGIARYCICRWSREFYSGWLCFIPCVPWGWEFLGINWCYGSYGRGGWVNIFSRLDFSSIWIELSSSVLTSIRWKGFCNYTLFLWTEWQSLNYV